MRLGGTGRYVTEVTDKFALAEIVAWAQEKNLPLIMIGHGSNIFWSDTGFPGLVVVNKILGVEEFQEDGSNLYITIGAGETWDDIVKKYAAKGFSGIEELSLIPGTAGATPIQNVGAYGREIKDVLVTVEAFDRQAGQLVTLRSDECGFGYRTSRFKTNDKGRFLISSITLHLTKAVPSPPFYKALQAYFDEHGVSSFTPQVIRDAVVAIRSSKLPDPALVANNGSFFANPIISTERFSQLQAAYPDIPHWLVNDDSVKISAAWLVEQAGFKGVHDAETGMGTWESQPLVLVNEHATKTANLLQFRDKIIASVTQKFHITLEQEPEFVELD